jgi:predicted deacylase
MSKASIELMPLLPLIMPSQVSGTVLAIGVIAPNPVITTRRLLNVRYHKKSKDGGKRGDDLVDEQSPSTKK